MDYSYDRLESTSSFYNNQALSIPYEEYRTIEFNSYFDIDHILAEQEVGNFPTMEVFVM